MPSQSSPYTVFLGCMIPYRYPFIEKASRLVLDKLGVPIFDAQGFSCCPDPTGVKPLNYKTWLSLAARNLAVAEQQGRDVLTFCTGCFETLAYTNQVLKHNKDLVVEVNETLAPLGLNYQGTLNIRHLVHVLYEVVGLERVKQHISHPFKTLRVAVQNSCHLTKPSDVAEFDDPVHPTVVDQFVEATGASSIDYAYKGKCCGASLSRTDRDLSSRIALEEQRSIRAAQADVIITVCPTCYTQLTLAQQTFRKELETQVPVLYLSELLALAMGFSPDDFGLKWHRPAAESLLDKRIAVRNQA